MSIDPALIAARNASWAKERLNAPIPQLGQSALDFATQRLTNGGVLLKYAVGSGQPHHKAVWCSDDLTQVYWGELDKSKSSGSIKVSELENVLIGAQTPAFERDSKKDKRIVDGNKCFSLSSKARSLDLECFTSYERDVWVLLFKHLLQRSKKGNKENGEEKERQDRRLLSPSVLADEVELLMAKLEDANTHIVKLEDGLRSATSAVTAPPLPSFPKLGQEGMEAEVASLKVAVTQAKSGQLLLEGRNRELENEIDRLKQEVQFFQNLATQKATKVEPVSSSSVAAPAALTKADVTASLVYQQCMLEIERLKHEIDLARIREKVRSFVPDTEKSSHKGHANGQVENPNVKRLSDFILSVQAIDVPVSILTDYAPIPDPGRGDDDEEEESRASFPDPLNGAIQNIVDFLPGSVWLDLNQYRLQLSQDEKQNTQFVAAARDTAKRILEELEEAIHDVSDPPLGHSDARALIAKALEPMNETQCAGDSYAAVKWMVGHPEMIVILSEASIPSSMQICVEQSVPVPTATPAVLRHKQNNSGSNNGSNANGQPGGVNSLLSVGHLSFTTTHLYRLCDAKKIFSSSTETQDVQKHTLLYCIATLTRRVGFNGDELRPPLVHVIFTKTPPEELISVERIVIPPSRRVSDRAHAEREMMSDPSKLCENCCNKVRAMYCNECRKELCVSCSTEMHRTGPEKTHSRLALSKKKQLDAKQPFGRTPVKNENKVQSPSSVASAYPASTSIFTPRDSPVNTPKPVSPRPVTPTPAPTSFSSAPPLPPTPTPVPVADSNLQAKREEELQLVTVAQKKASQSPTENKWYLVDSQWLAAWKQFVSGDAARPGAISNARLLKKDGAPQANLKVAQDYRALPFVVWKQLHDLYGGGPHIVRVSPDIYDKAS